MRRHVVIGGGVGGVCCAEELCRLAPRDDVVLVSASPVLKGVAGLTRLTPRIEEFTVVEQDPSAVARPNLTVLRGRVAGVDLERRCVHVAPFSPASPSTPLAAAAGAGKGAAAAAGGPSSPSAAASAAGGPSGTSAAAAAAGERAAIEVPYDSLCVAAGARPKVLARHERVVTLRDTESIKDFAARLKGARRVVVVGNGGIALELVGAVRGVEVVWVLRHGHIGDAFFDADAAQFLLEEMTWRQQQEEQRQHEQDEGQQQQEKGQHQQHQQQNEQQAQKRGASSKPSSTPGAPSAGTLGAAAGPDWVQALPRGGPAAVTIERHAAVAGVFDSRAEALGALAATEASRGLDSSSSSSSSGGSGSGGGGSGNEEGWPAWVALSGPGGSQVVGADLIVSAIGVEPATEWLPAALDRAQDGGLLVDANLRTSDPAVFAVGDCCTLRPDALAPHFFQMRLWTQARLMGLWAAHGMVGVGEELDGLSFAFELFTHATRFLGKKVVLLGLYNGQRLDKEPSGDVVTYARTLGQATAAATFVRVLLLRGRMQGAVLIGETELEETFENLILDGLDLSGYGPALLDPNIELDHVFD